MPHRRHARGQVPRRLSVKYNARTRVQRGQAMEKPLSIKAETAQRVADMGAATSVVTVAGLSLSQVNEIVQIIAGLVAIVAGACAAYYHVTRANRG